MSDDDKIEAWLAGKLSDEEAKALEASLENTAPTAPADDDFLGIKAEPISEEVDLLIKHVRDEGGHTPPDIDEWRDILQPSDAPNILGTLGREPRYEISSVIAVGGMSIVFKGRDPKLNRTVAIKTLTPELTANRITHERFLREARSASRLEHDHIIPIYGVHDEDGVPFIAMKFIDGGTLQHLLDSESEISIERQQSIARQMAMALDFAHGEGVIHRDIKPANILLDSDGERAWLCDFGVARSTEDPSLTYAGSVAGTPQYMAPEQASGEKYDHRCDLFSLGSVFYHCATGQPAFAGKTTRAVLKNLAEKDARPPRSLNPNLPRWYDRLIGNLIAKDPADRLPDAASVVRCLSEKSAPRAKQRFGKTYSIIGFGIATALIAFLFLSKQPDSEPEQDAAQVSIRIDGHSEAHESIAAAVKAASDGDVILISGPQVPLEVDGIVIPTGKSLTLRAVPLLDFKTTPRAPAPYITTRENGALGITSHSPLTFDGLRFITKPVSGGEPILRMVGTRGKLIGCGLSGFRIPVLGENEIKSRVIELYEGAEIDVEGSRISTLHGQAITITDGSARVKIIDSRISTFYGIVVGDQAVEIDCERSEFFGQHFIKGMSGKFPDVNCRSKKNVFSTARALVWIDHQEPTAVRDQIRWESTSDRHPLGKATLLISGENYHARAHREYALGTTTQPLPETKGWIENSDTGERFTTLRAAFANPPEKGSLRLVFNGDIVCQSGVTTPRDLPLELRAAPGSSPTVIFTENHHVSLMLQGPTTVEGIAFVRRHATEGTSGLSIVHCSHQGAFSFDRCRFESSPNIWSRSSGIGLGFSNVDSAEVRDCTIIMPGAAALLIDHTIASRVPLVAPKTKVKLERCLVAGSLAVYHRSSIGKALTSFTADRCVFVGERLWQHSVVETAYPLKLEISDSLIDMKKTYFEIEAWRAPLSDAQSMRKSITWDGRSNYHRPDTPLAIFTFHAHSIPESPKDLAALRFDSFLTEFKNATEPDAKITPLFDRIRMRYPISATGLLDLLPEDHSSPARETLEQLADEEP